MTTNALRDARVILVDMNEWAPWYRQFKLRCEGLKMWELVDPEGTKQMLEKPVLPDPPEISSYESIISLPTSSSTASSSRTRGNTQPARRDESVAPSARGPPIRISDLSITGQDDYRTDLEAYKLRIESYKYKENAYKEEQAKYDQLIRHIVDTVSPHLQLTCCDLSKPIRDWIKLLQETVGIDSEDERLRARERYQNALRPMRTPGHWETWLTEYDQAATRAESLGVSEVQNVQDVINDFLGAIGKIAPSWKATFSGPGYDPATMNRKKVMKLFRDHMSQSNPSKGKQKSAFAAGEVSFLAGGESDQDIQGDASGMLNRAPSAQTQGNPAKSGKKRKADGQQTKTKPPRSRIHAAAGDECLACGQRHHLSDCYYAFPEKAPEWFKFNRTIARLVEYKMNNDNELQRAMNNLNPLGRETRLTNSSRSSSMPQMKMSQTPDVQPE